MKCPNCHIAEWIHRKKKNVIKIKTETYDGYAIHHKFCNICNVYYTSTEVIDIGSVRRNKHIKS